ncbi:MAG TPA: phosphatase PAP2-related protein [Candidatus Kapabacteria bacterium]|nr:phosphatase PAP2-related protein [Candidatus Kapabacteria bacterium]
MQHNTTSSWRGAEIRNAAISVTALVVVLVAYSRFLAFNETRAGSVLNDPLLARLPAIDASIPIFVLIYSALLLALITRLRDSRTLITTVHAYILLVLLRMLMMYLVPLDPPRGMIMLVDPLASTGTGIPMARDLFFSGHTATLFLLALTAQSRVQRILLLVATVTVAALVLLQHCHYAIDVVVAFPSAYACSVLAQRLQRLIGPVAR